MGKRSVTAPTYNSFFPKEDSGYPDANSATFFEIMHSSVSERMMAHNVVGRTQELEDWAPVPTWPQTGLLIWGPSFTLLTLFEKYGN